MVAAIAPFASAVEGPENDDRATYTAGNFQQNDCATTHELFSSGNSTAPQPPVAEQEPAPQVLADELPRTGPEDVWLAGLALMLLGAGLLTLARGKAMGAPAYASGTCWTSRRP